MGLYRVDREVEHGGDLFQGLVEHVLEDHHAALRSLKLRPQLAGQSEHLRPAVAVRRGPSAQAASPSSMVTPVSPLSPKAKTSAYFGSSSTETTFSPNSRGGIGAPKRARNATRSRPI